VGIKPATAKLKITALATQMQFPVKVESKPLTYKIKVGFNPALTEGHSVNHSANSWLLND